MKVKMNGAVCLYQCFKRPELYDETMIPVSTMNITKENIMSKHIRQLLIELRGTKENHKNQT